MDICDCEVFGILFIFKFLHFYFNYMVMIIAIMMTIFHFDYLLDFGFELIVFIHVNV